MLLFILSLIICIIIHEGAHCIVAKMCGCKVEVFSIGFGKALYKRKIEDTVYQIAPFLLGGFCQLKGELDLSDEKDSFSNLTYSNKVAIAVAGCVANILTGLICIMIARDYFIYAIMYFGVISVALGLTNLIPFPALDGSYPFLVWLEKFMGKERGYILMGKIMRIGFIFIMILNVLCIPWIIIMFIKGMI